jgi:tartrate-resistant acid phosphatase type 5
MNSTLNRRDFLRQSFAFSALAALGASKSFALPPNPAAQHYLMVGDWGWSRPEEGQQQVAAAMAAYARSNALHTQALFMLGDSWYGDLNGGVDSPRWQTGFEQMYPANVFPGPAYSIMGNHDYQHMPMNVSKVEAELAYAKRGHSRWTQPALWYTLDIASKETKEPLLHIIALDSNVPKKKETLAPVDFTLTPAQYDEQLKWLEAELSKPTKAPFRIVMGHHPIFSNGKHGDTPMLVRDWEPLLRKHKVHAYLAGHDHDLQHLEYDGHPTSFVCSGAGGADLYDLKIDEKQRGPFAHKVFGFTHLEATPTLLTFRHVDAQGKVLHTFSKSTDGKVTMLG